MYNIILSCWHGVSLTQFINTAQETMIYYKLCNVTNALEQMERLFLYVWCQMKLICLIMTTPEIKTTI